MFPQPFVCLESRHLPGVLQYFVMSWVYLGIPSLVTIFVGSLLAKKFRISRINILGRITFRAIVLSMPLMGLIFGLLTGYFASWTYVGSSQRLSTPWYYESAILGAPGDAMANSYGGDWQDEEAWDYRSDIMIWNGLFWASVATVGTFVVYLAAKPDEVAALTTFLPQK